MSKPLKLVLVVLAFLILAIAALVGYYEYNTKYRPTPIDTVKSPDGRWEARLEMLGEPVWPFGPVKARVTVTDRERGKTVERFETKVYDDGATLGEHHWTVEWGEERVTVTFSASEQEDEVWEIALA